MKKTRIMLALQKKLNCRQNEAKEKRVKMAIAVSKANAEEKKAQAEDKLNNLLRDFNKDTDATDFIQKVSKAMFAQDEAEAAIAQLNKVETYLFEQIEEPAPEDDPEEQQ